MTATDIAAHPIHLGWGATAEIEPRFTGSTDWYAAYGERHATDGAEGRLVSMFSFDRSWDSWEMHPRGSEVVLCVSGSMTLHQEHADGTVATVTLRPGQYAINPPGTWHGADIEGRDS
jgi:mannose-6-phosphate isomerase-like protein (cupin superfamily)